MVGRIVLDHYFFEELGGSGSALSLSAPLEARPGVAGYDYRYLLCACELLLSKKFPIIVGLGEDAHYGFLDELLNIKENNDVRDQWLAVHLISPLLSSRPVATLGITRKARTWFTPWYTPACQWATVNRISYPRCQVGL